MNRLLLHTIMALFIFTTFISSVNAQVNHRYQADSHMKWWNEARFGMFIHWGPDAIPSLHWKGKAWNEDLPSKQTAVRYPAHESILNIPKRDWENEVIGEFNPQAYNPEEWVQIAKKAGMKYMVLTVKHHNGFCLWPGLDGYDIRKTKYKKDPVAMFVEACRKYDMRVGFYYSQLDWHDPDAIGDHIAKTYPDGWITNPERFFPRIKSQIKDLLTRYGKIDILWFDGQWIEDWTIDMGEELTDYIRTLQPNIIVNDRIGKGIPSHGDYYTPEQRIPANGVPGVYWETCMTMNDTWFYVKQDSNWKKSRTMIQNLVDIASKGGNYLLNVGPDYNGVIPIPSIERLDTISNWIKVNGESIYSTTPGPFKTTFQWGRTTARKENIYLHLFEVPEESYIKLPFFDRPVKRAYVLNIHSQQDLPINVEKGHYKIDIPEKIKNEIKNEIIPVIKVECW